MSEGKANEGNRAQGAPLTYKARLAHLAPSSLLRERIAERRKKRNEKLEGTK